MSARDYREWRENTPAGKFAAREGITVEVDHDQAEQMVEQTRQAYRRHYGRELHDDEIRRVRTGAEMRSVTATGGLPHQTTHELASAHGWGVLVEPRRQGIASLMADEWRGDPAVIAATQEAMAVKAQLAEAAEQAWRGEPGDPRRGVARSS